MNYENIILEKKDGIALLTMNRPDSLNAMTPAMRTEIFETLISIDNDPQMRVTIITGAGRGFCAGADLSPGSERFSDKGRKEEPQFNPKSKSKFFYSLRKPIIAAINGPAVGVGISMPLLCDIRIAGESAKMGFVFNRRGILPEYNVPWVLTKIIGVGLAAELLYTGRILSAHEALDFGIVNKVVPDVELIPTSIKIAQEIVDNCAPVSVALTKRLLFSHLAEPDYEKAEAESKRYMDWVRNMPDAKEGVASFLEKRPPKWGMKVPDDMPDF